jgi:hypothetical protein
MDWKVKDFDEEGYVGYYPLPSTRVKTFIKTGETYKVCVLAQAACFCALDDAYTKGEIKVCVVKHFAIFPFVILPTLKIGKYGKLKIKIEENAWN